MSDARGSAPVREQAVDEFRAVIIELAHHFETGEPFDTRVLKLKYWTGLSRA